MQRPLVVQMQPLEVERRADLARSAAPAPVHFPVPAPFPIPALRLTSALCAHGPRRAVNSAPTQRSTPDADANARSQRAL